MTIYFFQLEAIPHPDNPEKEECVGAYINCWVKSINEKKALNRAKKYVSNEGWEVIDILDRFIASRDLYESDNEAEESLECFDKAMRNKISAIFYIFSSEDDDDKDA
ncbi:hypothetical protein OF830_26175 [Bacillus paramycoides]|uniref:hypothetical protein n=1 Tax=Bacillus paramycoides TaxID=2026194 RepID=UPI002243228C|nr:hypothetical protein [Bacillus paramycoides]MCW9134280.1 hypothetical protein [Bacillus paramycoides]